MTKTTNSLADASNFVCPHCGENEYYHGLSVDDDYNTTILCRKCDKEFRVKAIVAKWVYLDKFGYIIE